MNSIHESQCQSTHEGYAGVVAFTSGKSCTPSLDTQRTLNTGMFTINLCLI